MDGQMPKTEEEWKQKLTPEQYNILREKGTEPAFSGEYYKNDGQGMYVCAGCGQELFSSEHKYESGSGWPSFWQAVEGDKIILRNDDSFGMNRVEAECSKCGSHLGHVFDDGPKPTGKRFCINSLALKFKEETKKDSD